MEVSTNMEEWKIIPNVSACYEVSTKGNIRKRNGKTCKLLNKQRSGKSSARVSIQGKQYVIARLVAETFIPNPENKPYVVHRSKDLKDDSVDNLIWCTSIERSRYIMQHNPLQMGNLVYCKELDVLFASLTCASIILRIPINTIESAIKLDKSCFGYHLSKYPLDDSIDMDKILCVSHKDITELLDYIESVDGLDRYLKQLCEASKQGFKST